MITGDQRSTAPVATARRQGRCRARGRCSGHRAGCRRVFKTSTPLLLQTCNGAPQRLTAAWIEPIFIYRKEDRAARADRAGAGFVDNSIALISCGKVGRALLPGAVSWGRTPSPRPALGSNRFPSPSKTAPCGVISVSLTLLRSQPPLGDDNG